MYYSCFDSIYFFFLLSYYLECARIRNGPSAEKRAEKHDVKTLLLILWGLLALSYGLVLPLDELAQARVQN